MKTIGVLGAGSWGTTLADLLARKGYRVRIWAYEPDVVAAINRHHTNEAFLPGAALAPSLSAVSIAAEAVRGADLVVSAAPSHAVRLVLRELVNEPMRGTIVVSATKGIEVESLQLMSQVTAELLPESPFVALSGPSFAQEVFAGQPTAVVAAGPAAVVEQVQMAFATPTFRVYRNEDVYGTELAGALKNVIAIAAGVLEGLGLGNNPRAALITRGLAEMTRLGVALGAQPSTFAGLAGMGDLILTTCGALSRNRNLGIAIAQGRSLAEHAAAHRTVAEGVNTTRCAIRLAKAAGVELPISAKVHELLFEGKPPALGIRELMERTLKAE